MADGSGDTVANDRQTRLAALLAEAEQAEAEVVEAASPEDVEEQALHERIQRARDAKAAVLLAKRRTTLAQQVERFRKAANGAYVVEPFDMEDHTPGAGMYVLRSPAKEVWKVFQDGLGDASDSAKVDRAYVNLTASCILWSDAPEDAAAWVAHREKYQGLVQAIGGAVQRLAGVADRARKR